MTWPDLVVIVLCILLGIVESRRGFVVAFFDLVGLVLTVEIAAATYRRLISPSISWCGAYLICVGAGVLVVAVVTTLLKRQTQIDIGAFDSAAAGTFGIGTALVLSHAMYGALILAYGRQVPVLAESAFIGQIYDLNAVHGFLGFMGRVGTTEVAR